MGEPARGLEFWGVRGTVATPVADRLRYGGNTICLATRLAGDDHLLLDCGTGGRLFGKAIEQGRSGRPTRVHILFSHYHFDHVEGLSLFAPLYGPDAAIRIYGVPPQGESLRRTFESLIGPPHFPVRISGAPAHVEYVELDGKPFTVGDVQIASLPLNHPGGCSAFRLERGGHRVVFATDHEHGDPAVDAALVAFSEGVDHLIYDATYLPEEYERSKKGWGHSTWAAGVATARAAHVRNLVLFHHDPDRTDDALDRLLTVVRAEFPSTTVAREGESVPL